MTIIILIIINFFIIILIVIKAHEWKTELEEFKERAKNTDRHAGPMCVEDFKLFLNEAFQTYWFYYQV